MEGGGAGGGVQLQGGLRIWGFLRWKQRFFEMDATEIRLCKKMSPAELTLAAAAARSVPPLSRLSHT